MEKNENSDKLKKLIQSLVQEELKRSSKEIAKIIKEQVRIQVKQQVNEILAEQFIKTMSNNNSIGQVFAEQTTTPVQKEKRVDKRVQEAERNAIRNNYNQKLKNLGVLGTDAQSLFEGLDGGSIAATPGAGINPYEDDDEGVDLSKLGW